MGCGCTSSMDGTSEAGYMDSFQGETPPFKPDLNFADIEDLEDKKNFVYNDEGEFANFLTKRARQRRQLRRDLVAKGDVTKEEARAIALERIPKQKLGKLVKNTLQGTTDAETQDRVDNAQEGRQVENVPPVEQDPSESTTGGSTTGGGQPTGGSTTGGGSSNGGKNSDNDADQAGLGKSKTILIVGGIAVLVIGGYFLFGKKLGIRK